MTTTAPTGRPTRLAVNKPQPDEDWRSYGACKKDPELFFPVGMNRKARTQERKAKAVCGGCPVRQECLDWALDTGQVMGVLGGLSESERWKLSGRPLPKYVAGVPMRPRFDRCVAAQDFIEERLAAGASIRSVAAELGVGRDMLKEAREFYLSEQQQETAALDAASEAVTPV